MSNTKDPWKDGRENQQHLTECSCEECDRCDYLIDGFYMACDECGNWGSQESDGWVLAQGIPFCSVRCAENRLGEGVEIQ